MTNGPTARGTALAVLDRIEREGAYANLALAEQLARSPLCARDRAFCAELVYGTVRWRARLDNLLDRLLAKPGRALPTDVRNLLRLSLYQLEFLPDIAPYAVVNEAVSLTRRIGRAGLAGLVNAVLRNYSRCRPEITLPGPENPAAHLQITLSHPAWLAHRWLERLGLTDAFALAEADNKPAPICLRVNTLRIGRDDLLPRFAAAGIAADKTVLAPEGIRLTGAGAMERLPGYDEGLFIAQDEAAMLVGHAVAPRPGERLLDLCAAPGGKTTHLAALSEDRAAITALDDHEHKIRLIEANCRRLGLHNVTAAAADARKYRPPEPAHGVLLDAPCTGTGVLRRRVDLRWRRSPEDLTNLVKLQRELLSAAAAMVAPGGRLVYSTCSLEPEENEEQIQWFQAQFTGFRAVSLRPHLPPAAANLVGDEHPWLYLWPHKQGTDGFFMCRLERDLIPVPLFP